jgi:glycosyltransferase involved in cell wall biosynthesis
VLAAYLEVADYIVIPSRIESIPVILSDALQKGCPMIATNVGDMGKMLIEHQAGYVVAPENPPALAHTLERACTKHESHKSGMAALYRLFDVHANATKVVNDVQSLGQQTPLFPEPQLSRCGSGSGQTEDNA